MSSSRQRLPQRRIGVALALCLLALAGCAGGDRPRGGPSGGLECVPYAREVSGIEIYGDAWTWWDGAAGRYQRGYRPEPGAVLVMQATGTMRRGHVAVVEAVVDPRQIQVTQANWGNSTKTRGRVERGTPVIDVSGDNSWRAVRVWNDETEAFGRVNPSFGFIYQRPAQLVSAEAAGGACIPPRSATNGG
jgi:surface antigen